MDISVFEVAGPVMIGPSSSHTAGAARLARVAREIASAVLGGALIGVDFGLHGSLWKTGKGHGTREALTAGALGMREDNEDISKAFELAESAGLAITFRETDLHGYHENSAIMTFRSDDGGECSVAGSSIGGGRVVVRSINDFGVKLEARNPTLIAFWRDVPGVLSKITTVFADEGVNIAVMRVSRREKGGLACCVIVTDSVITDDIMARVRRIRDIESAIAVEGD